MKIYFMKQQALDYMKANMNTLYKNYYQFSTPEWIDQLFDYDPFEVFMDVEPFDLADLNLAPGEIDLQNCKILYSNLRGITDSQAADERLWAGLCNKNFYEYMRTRSQLARRHLKKSADDAQAIISRFYYRNSGRGGMFRNALARCWWTGRLTYSEKYANHWELLDAIGSEDLISKISDIFYSNTYSSNIEITEGFCEGLKFFRDRGIKVANREHIRPTAQYLNAVGGGELLDMFTADEIKKLVIERMNMLINGDDTALLEEEYGSHDDDLETDENEINDAEEVEVDYEDFMELLEPSTEIDLNFLLGRLEKAEYGCIMHIHKQPENKYYNLPMPLAGEHMYDIQRYFLGKPVGAEFKHNNSVFTLEDISRK